MLMEGYWFVSSSVSVASDIFFPCKSHLLAMVWKQGDIRGYLVSWEVVAHLKTAHLSRYLTLGLAGNRCSEFNICLIRV